MGNSELKEVVTTGFFITSVLTANIIGGIKLFDVLGYIVPAGTIAFTIGAVVFDAYQEVYGRDKARRLTYASVLANIYMIGLLAIGYVIPALTPEMQEVYARLFMPAFRLVAASITAFLVSQLSDIYVFSTLREMTRGRHLWLRADVSTAIGQLIDTIVFIIVAFAGTMPVGLLLAVIFNTWVWKVVMAVATTPFVYGAVYLLRLEYPWIRIAVRR